MSEKAKWVPRLANLTFVHTLVIKSTHDSFTRQTLSVHCICKVWRFWTSLVFSDITSLVPLIDQKNIFMKNNRGVSSPRCLQLMKIYLGWLVSENIIDFCVVVCWELSKFKVQEWSRFTEAHRLQWIVTGVHRPWQLLCVGTPISHLLPVHFCKSALLPDLKFTKLSTNYCRLHTNPTGST